ncbi:MAG: HAMP domain-containing sensor histidine kinase [bacterium]
MKGSIFRRVLLMMVLMSLSAGIMILATNIYQESKLVEDLLIENNLLQAKLAAQAIEAGSRTRLWPFELLRHVSASDDILFWRVVEPSGRIKLANDAKMQNKFIIDDSLGIKESLVKDSFSEITNEKIKVIIEPMTIAGEESAFFFLGFSLKKIDAMQRQIILGSIILFLLIIFFASLVSYYMSKSFAKPLNYLMEGVEALNQGRVGHQIRVLSSEDEFGELAVSFNAMSSKLKETRERDKLISDMKSEFITIAAHQLRTPLTGIKWTMKMLLDGDSGSLNEEQKKFLMKGFESNERIIKLVNDLLNVAHIEEGKMGLDFKLIDFGKIIEEVLSSMGGMFARKNIKIEKKVTERGIQVYADKQKLLLAFTNILDNAAKYTLENGLVKIDVSEDSGKLNIIVSDNGVGIPEKDKKRIFTKFYRGSNAVNMQTEGTGLGLFLVKNIIEKHKGKIDIKSEEGKGTEVRIFLPIKEK